MLHSIPHESVHYKSIQYESVHYKSAMFCSTGPSSRIKIKESEHEKLSHETSQEAMDIRLLIGTACLPCFV
jgi:hypothetical protein